MKRIIPFTFLLFLCNFQLNRAATIYVTELGAGGMNGTSWANAYPGDSLQIAINASGFGDEVWVACGTYKPTAGTNRTIAFSMQNNVAIYGSFQGTESLLSERLLSCGPCSILSGEIGVPGNSDNSYKVIRNQGLNITAILDGFVIRDGHDDRVATSTNGLGGGIMNVGSGPGGVCSPSIRNCVITNNRAEFGGGIFNDGYNGGNANPIIINCIISNNYATGGGGGIDNFGLNGCASPDLYNCLITNNTAEDAAGGMYCWGGGGGLAFASITNTVIANNNVISGNGGGVIIDRSNSGGGSGGGSGTANILARNCIIRNNTAAAGPQFYTYENGTMTATNSNIDTLNQFFPHVSVGSNIGNIDANPLFLNVGVPIGIDSCWMTEDDGYHLQNLSPCIDSGDSTNSFGLDLAFNLRIVGINVDMGAYEYAYSIAGIEEEVEFLQLFPNPVMDELNIITHQPGTLVLLNTLGEVIQKIDNNESDSYQIALVKLPAGVYYVRNELSGNTRKFIKF